jgi:hypothetical protein
LARDLEDFRFDLPRAYLQRHRHPRRFHAHGLVFPDGPVIRQDHAYLVPALLQFSRQPLEYVAQPAGPGEGSHFGSRHQDSHCFKMKGI